MHCLIKRATIDEIIANRDASIAMAREAAEKMQEALEMMERADQLRRQAFIAKVDDGAGGQVEQGLGLYTEQDNDHSYRRLFAPIQVERAMRAWVAHTDARTWASLYSMMGLSAVLTTRQKEEMRKALSGFDVPEVTLEAAQATLETAMQEATYNWRLGLAEVFSSLDRSFRSHDGFKVGKRVILEHAFDSWGAFSYGARRDMLSDIERAFAVLDGVDPRPVIGTMERLIREGRAGGGLCGRQSTHEGPYMRINVFKNGNAHLWFTRDDLVEKLNRELAAFYGEVLADAMPAERDISERKTGPTAMVLCKDLQFYPTPPEAARALVGDTGCISVNGKVIRVLEPSAGEGALIQAMMDSANHYAVSGLALHVDAYEVDPVRAQVCSRMRRTARCDLALNVREQNFLNVHPRPVYDVVIMNPPFSGTHWMTHVLHAFRFLKPNGTLRAILPVSAQLGTSKAHREFQAWAEANQPKWHRGSPFRDLPVGSFRASGTNINTVILSVVSRGA